MIRAVDPRPPGAPADLAERFGTPLYVFDGERLAAEAEAFRAAWGPGVAVAYSMKSNPLLGITARLHRAGCWAEVASGFEYRAARRAGVPGERIVFNGPLKTADELRRALAEGAAVVADGAEQVREIARQARWAGPGARVGLRLVPPDRAGRDRFGMPARAAAAAARMLARAGLPLTGLHVHLGAYQLGPLPPTGPPVHGVTVQYPVPAERFAARRGAPARDGRAGGRHHLARPGRGLARRGRPGRAPGRRARGPRAPPRRTWWSSPAARWCATPDGCWCAWWRGAAAARWWSTPGSPRCPACCGSARPVRAADPRPGPERATDLFGPLCLQHDALAREVPLGPLRVGDLVWIGQAGAYAMAQASPFIHLRPGAVMVEAGRASVLRARETDDEALGAQAEPLLVGPEGRVVSA